VRSRGFFASAAPQSSPQTQRRSTESLRAWQQAARVGNRSLFRPSCRIEASGFDSRRLLPSRTSWRQCSARSGKVGDSGGLRTFVAAGTQSLKAMAVDGRSSEQRPLCGRRGISAAAVAPLASSLSITSSRSLRKVCSPAPSGKRTL